jgi:hypothetical protein
MTSSREAILSCYLLRSVRDGVVELLATLGGPLALAVLCFFDLVGSQGVIQL